MLPKVSLLQSTGGGCTAMQKDFGVGLYMLVTDTNLGHPETISGDVEFGVYDGDDCDPIYYKEFINTEGLFSDRMFKLLITK